MKDLKDYVTRREYIVICNLPIDYNDFKQDPKVHLFDVSRALE